MTKAIRLEEGTTRVSELNVKKKRKQSMHAESTRQAGEKHTCPRRCVLRGMRFGSSFNLQVAQDISLDIMQMPVGAEQPPCHSLCIQRCKGDTGDGSTGKMRLHLLLRCGSFSYQATAVHLMRGEGISECPRWHGRQTAVVCRCYDSLDLISSVSLYCNVRKNAHSFSGSK